MENVIEPQIQKPDRNAGVDLLRIIAIVLICIFHANQTLTNVTGFQSFTFADFFTRLIKVFGSIGNIIFIICSSYFLVDKTKTRPAKAINLLLDSMTISIVILIGFVASGYTFTLNVIERQLFPDIYSNNWFIPCYVIFYLLSPIVINGLRELTKKAHFAFVLFFLIVYGGLSLYSVPPLGYELLQFFNILIIVAFVKWHMPSISKHKEINALVFVAGMLFVYALYFNFYALSKRNDFFSRFDFVSMWSPLLIIPLIALFNLFKDIHFKSRFISYLSSCSLFIYVIHENYLLRWKIRPQYFAYMITNYGAQYSIVWMLICGWFMIIVGFILSAIYKETFHRGTEIISNWLYKIMQKMFDKICSKLFKDPIESHLE